MSNRDDKEKAPSFPEPLEFLNEELAPQFQRFQELEAMRKACEKNNTKPRDLKLIYPLPNTPPTGPSNNPFKNGFMIEVELKKLDTYLNQKIERLIKDFEIKADKSKEIREVLVEKKYPNPFKDKSPREIEWLRTHSKDIETSAQFFLNERRRFREGDKSKDAKVNEVGKSEIDLEVANKNVQAVKSRFMQSLGFSKAKETPLEKVYDFIKDKDVITGRE